jgi:hypothetical protein
MTTTQEWRKHHEKQQEQKEKAERIEAIKLIEISARFSMWRDLGQALISSMIPAMVVSGYSTLRADTPIDYLTRPAPQDPDNVKYHKFDMPILREICPLITAVAGQKQFGRLSDAAKDVCLGALGGAVRDVATAAHSHPGDALSLGHYYSALMLEIFSNNNVAMKTQGVDLRLTLGSLDSTARMLAGANSTLRHQMGQADHAPMPPNVKLFEAFDAGTAGENDLWRFTGFNHGYPRIAAMRCLLLPHGDAVASDIVKLNARLSTLTTLSRLVTCIAWALVDQKDHGVSPLGVTEDLMYHLRVHLDMDKLPSITKATPAILELAGEMTTIAGTIAKQKREGKSK